MGIDWVTFSAQIVNLIVLGWLLKRFLYKPILNAIDAREKAISSRVSEANDLAKKAEQEISDLRLKKDSFEKDKYAILSKAKEEAENTKERLLRDAKIDVEIQKEVWFNDLEKQKQAFFDNANDAIIASFINLANKALTDLASSNLETQMLEVFKQKLNKIDAVEKEAFVKNAIEDGVIKAVFSFDIDDKENVSKFIKNSLNLKNDVEIIFEVDKKLICGVELKAKEKSLSWSMKEHLNNFTKELKSALNGE
ncbi:MAG: ATP synthase subunit b, sodium ion specific [Alphaproteobacteria bacterium ADurb.Bin438]|nr:MAG: ATP synthase subunit b, sodium ion specific [Alphaproteobacteria bacterium ADurb.Bin438]